MPGIFGFVGAHDVTEDLLLLARMLRSVSHEPFYRTGTTFEHELGLSAGWALRGDPGAQAPPVWNLRHDICLIFSGEDFSAPAGRHDSASWLLERYEQQGEEFLTGLNGWFSGLIIDRRAHKVILFNDRFGLGRIYLHQRGDRVYFASEAKALLAAEPQLRRLRSDSLGELISCGCPLEGRTLFDGIEQLPPASCWTFTPDGALTRRRYFDVAQWQGAAPLGEAEYYEALKETFARVLPRYTRSAGPMAVSLTGGVDSRMVMAWTHMPPGALPAFTFGGMFRECVDVSIAREVARVCGQPHEILPVGEEFLAQFPKLAEQTVYFSDGTMDVSGSPDLYVNRLARHIAPLRLTGNYGGEILRRIVAFKPMNVSTQSFAPEFAAHIDAARAHYGSVMTDDKLQFVLTRQVPWHHFSRLSVEQSQLTVRTPYLDNELVQLSFRAPPSLATSNAVALRLIADGNPALGRFGTDRGVAHRSIPLVTPLKNFFQEFTFKAEYAYDYGMPNWLARADSAVRPLHLERLFLGRHKFYHFRYWYRNQLAGFLKDVLLDPRSLARPYLNPRMLEKMVRSHVTGQANYTLELHRLLTLELIQRTLIET
jgi:asparagine synthase (glutamine-hydrolysing)